MGGSALIGNLQAVIERKPQPLFAVRASLWYIAIPYFGCPLVRGMAIMTVIAEQLQPKEVVNKVHKLSRQLPSANETHLSDLVRRAEQGHVGLSPTQVKTLQPTIGNRAVRRLLDPASAEGNAPLRHLGSEAPLQRVPANRALPGRLEQSAYLDSVVQRVQWTNQTTARAGLSAQLGAGIDLARANQTGLAQKPAWILSRVQDDIQEKWNVNGRAAKQTEFEAKWDTKPEIQVSNPNKAVWVAAQVAKALTARLAGAASQVKQRVGEQPGVPVADQFKWNVDFNNSDGFLPDLAGAGGYKEYYAEPNPADPPSGGFWGQNRVLRGVNDGTWWVTADHYENFTKVT
jgi:hypothetical protein